VADTGIVRSEIVDGDRINSLDIRCPSCGNNTLVLTGQAQIPQREFMEAGIVTMQLQGLYEEGSFDLQEIDCPQCETKFIIKDHMLYRLEVENDKLRKQLARQKATEPVDVEKVH
jgi:DNA-directed RNA polymerase subunit RPC12/RpoP